MGKYVGPSRTTVSILGFSIHERVPAIMWLQVHLLFEQVILIAQKLWEHIRLSKKDIWEQ